LAPGRGSRKQKDQTVFLVVLVFAKRVFVAVCEVSGRHMSAFISLMQNARISIERDTNPDTVIFLVNPRFLAGFRAESNKTLFC
jgi:hypothetical protein